MIIQAAYTIPQIEGQDAHDLVAIVDTDGLRTTISKSGQTPLNDDLTAWLAAGGLLTDEPLPLPPVPQSISDRQFFQQLAIAGIVSPQEALAAVRTGEIPAALSSFLETLPEDERFAAEMLLSGAVEFRRDHPLTVAIGASQDMDSTQIDAFFRSAALL